MTLRTSRSLAGFRLSARCWMPSGKELAATLVLIAEDMHRATVCGTSSGTAEGTLTTWRLLSGNEERPTAAGRSPLNRVRPTC
jgi:hypothetical protein